MRNKMALGLLALAAWVLSATSAWAVSLGKIDVASHLGEPFYAEVPLRLDPGESISNVYVQIASPADYRILEVYRDPALNNITADVKTDKRGPRVVLSSDSGIEAPFFNLVLKLRYERATHFKKYPIFLDIPQMARPKRMTTLPTIKQGQRQVPIVSSQMSAPVTTTVVTTTPAAKPATKLPGSAFTPFDGWARTSRYGPMVYGDTITTVAERLQIDKRYSRQQVMMAIFEKNRVKFDHDNINLIRAGTFLDVPTAAEVEQHTPRQARDFLARQEKVWKQLIKQPKYAAVAEAQKNRYSKRVRVGERASGVASAPMTSQGRQGTAAQSTHQGTSGTAGNAVQTKKLNMLQQQLQQLQQQNSKLQGQLTSTQKQLADASASSDAAAAAAANAKVKRLQIQLARLQAQRDQALQQAKAQPSPMGLLTYGLLAVIVLLLLVVGYLMRREPAHPAAEYAGLDGEPQFAAAPTLAEPQQRHVESHDEAHADMFEEAPEIDVEEVPEFDSTKTMQMSSADVTKEFTDSIPDLTDEDTGKMEPFEQEIEEEPNPNVDYLAEADVYLRYGMEDEAIQQVKMALKLDPHNADAHIKLVQVLKAKNDQAALDEAIAKGRQSLGGGSLQRFEEAIANLDQIVDAFADTLPPTMAEEMGELPEMGDEASEAPSETETLIETLTETELPEVSPTAETEAEAGGGLEDVDIEWPEFEDTETSLQEAQNEVAEQEFEEIPPAAPSAAGESGEPAEPAETLAPSDKDFDLSDFEIPDTDTDTGSEEGGESRASSFVDTSDLEKTVAIDWSQETSVEDMDQEETIAETNTEDLLAESAMESASEPEAPAAEEEQKPEQAAAPEAAASPAMDGGIDLGDLDFDQIQEEKAHEPAPDDEFSSTIRTSSMLVEGVDSEEEPSFDISTRFEVSDEATESSEDKAADKEKEQNDAGLPDEDEGSGSGLLLDIGEDFDKTQKLDDLLSEFADESEKDSDDKKD